MSGESLSANAIAIAIEGIPELVLCLTIKPCITAHSMFLTV